MKPKLMTYRHPKRINFGAFLDFLPESIGVTIFFGIWEWWFVLGREVIG